MTLRQHIPVAKGGWKPALSLLLLAPVSGELLTSSAPPMVFFIPWVFLLFTLLYGCGALLVREFAVRWDTGWIGILLMGAAYGIFEEALGAKSFFDPHWRALGQLGSHGRWMGVNWVWTLGLTLFHSCFCIAFSILAASLPFPAMRRERWVSNKVLALVGVAYLLVLTLFFQKGNENHYQAPAAYYWVSTGIAILLIAAARLAPRRSPSSQVAAEVPPRYLGWSGFISILLFVVILYAVPATGASAWVTAGLLVGLAWGMYFLLARWSHQGEKMLGPNQELALVAGVLCAWAIQGPFQELNPARGASARGMSLVGLASIGYVFWLRRVVRRGALADMEGGSYAS